jgi:nuclear RNA export factor
MSIDRDRTRNAIQKALSDNTTTSQANFGRPAAKSGTSQAVIRGWKQSKASSNPDGGIQSLVAFLEKKMTPSDSKASANTRTRITKWRVEGDALIVSVRPELMFRLLKINGFSFAGAALTIEEYGQPAVGEASTADTKAKLTAFLGNRYFQQTKLLNLSGLGDDPDLVSMGLFSNTSTKSKFFPALMKMWETGFDSTEKCRNAVDSVSLANNQLDGISDVTTLSQTIPNVKNLDLSNNNFKDFEALSGWRWKFRRLEFLDLTGSPLSADPSFKDTMLKWYPKLRILNNTEVRTAAEIAAQGKAPIPVQPAYFRDDSQIAENFVRAFFIGYDNDRNDLVNGIYDNNSTFSFNVNTSIPRASQQNSIPSWDPYIKKSRNILKINHLPAQMSRSYVGSEKIRELWNTLPRTKHPDMTARPEEWLIECHSIPGLPDPSGQCEVGVGGLLIVVHGKFDEISPSKVDTRSFDRTFVIGPGGGARGVRVISDMLTLRAYGGHDAWDPNSQQPNPPGPRVNHPQAPDGYGAPAPGKTDDRVQQEQMILQMSFKTRMTLVYSEMALSGNGWNMEAALRNFEELKVQGKLPSDAFLLIM